MTPRAGRFAVLAVALSTCLGAGFWLHAIWLTTRSPAAASGRSSPVNTADALQAAFVAVAERARPAVVHIGTIQVAQGRPPTEGPGSDDSFFKDFFDQFFGPHGTLRGPMPPGEFRRPGVGSGVITDRRGYVLTNFHVIQGADKVTVRLTSKKEYVGRIVGTDPRTDLAVVKFEPDEEPPVATLGNSDALRVGEWAIAIGNPFGLDQTVTVGVISATGRADVGIASHENFIQTDASINPGNSGGPLLNLHGEVIGINTAIVAAGQGIGFAIPANMARRVSSQLVDRGKVLRGWLGVSLQPLTAELAQSLGVSGTQGAIIARVTPGSPAAAADLRPNDVVVTFNGTVVTDYHQLQNLAADAEVGKTVPVEVIRDRGRRTVSVKIAEAPDTMAGAR